MELDKKVILKDPETIVAAFNHILDDMVHRVNDMHDLLTALATYNRNATKTNEDLTRKLELLNSKDTTSQYGQTG